MLVLSIHISSLKIKANTINSIVSENISDKTNPKLESVENQNIKEKKLVTNDRSILELVNGTMYSTRDISYGEKEYFVLKNVSFNSALYRIKAYELNPYLMNIDVYVKFGSLPSKSDYDYKTQTNNEIETIDIEIPYKNEYGNLYIMIVCVFGSGNFQVYAHYIFDSNGCWRNAEDKDNPIYLTNNITITNTLSSMNMNDFFKIYLESGQILKLQCKINTSDSCHLELNLYDENHAIITSKKSSISFNLSLTITSYYCCNYYIQFRNPDKTVLLYNGTIFDENPDSNNRYSNAQLLSPSLFFGSMHEEDFNDYYYFIADSGEHINIQVTISDYLCSPHYDAFLYVNNEPIDDLYYRAATKGTNLNLEFHCPEYLTGEVFPNIGNKIYLRLWNAAECNETYDSCSSYMINLTRSWSSIDDRLSTAPSFTSMGNDTTPKNGNLDGENNINDWFRITTKVGYTITISVNNTNSNPYAYLEGYLIDNSDTIVMFDTTSNISISYTSQYNGNYYFRLYEVSSQNPYYYSDSCSYQWFIYTSSKDDNDNFQHADWIDLNTTISSRVSKTDIDDFYVFNVPSGYLLNISGGGLLNLELFLYDSAQIKVDSNPFSPWSIEYQNKEFRTEYYYVKINNAANHNLASYNITIVMTKIDPDGDGTINAAKSLSILTSENAFGNDSIGDSDINDYFMFVANAGDKINVIISGNMGLITRLVINDGFGGELVLDEYTITADNIAILECYPNAYYGGDFYYFRVCALGGMSQSNYDWNVSLIEYDTEDGYQNYANILDVAPIITKSSLLTNMDINDWYVLKMPSGSNIDVKISTINNNDVYIGVQFIGIFSPGIIYSNELNLEFSYRNSFGFSYPVYFQIVNEMVPLINYTIEISITYIDNDNNGAKELASNLLTNINIMNSLGYEDINDYFIIEIESGYNLTILFNLYNPSRASLTFMLWDKYGNLLAQCTGNTGLITYTNVDFNSTIAFLQFHNSYLYCGSIMNKDIINYYFSASLTSNDTDGSFDQAEILKRKSNIISDHLFADETTLNFSDINDFYVIKLWRANELKLHISIINTHNSFLGICIYDSDRNIISFYIGNDSTYDFSLICNSTGKYYIRFYNVALSFSNYTMTVNLIKNNALLDFDGMLVWVFVLAIISFLFIILIIVAKTTILVRRERSFE